MPPSAVPPATALSTAGLVRRFAVFAFVGLAGTACHYAVLVAAVQGLGVGALWASSAGAVVGAVVNYLLNRSVTFRSSARHRVALPKFLAVAAFGFALNAAVMALALAQGLHFLLAQVVATLAVLASGFIGNQFWTFRERS